MLFLAVFALVTMVRRPVLRKYFSQSAMTSVAAQAAVLVGFLAVLAVLARPYMNMAGDSYLMSWPGNYETGCCMSVQTCR